MPIVIKANEVYKNAESLIIARSAHAANRMANPRAAIAAVNFWMASKDVSLGSAMDKLLYNSDISMVNFVKIQSRGLSRMKP